MTKVVRQGGRFAGAASPGTEAELQTMAAQERSRFLAPFPGRIAQALAEQLWQVVEPFVNGERPASLPSFDLATAWDELRRRLRLVVVGKPPMPPEPREQAAQLPLCLHVRPDGVVYWTILQPGEPLRRDERGATVQPEPERIAHRLVNEIGGTCLILLWHPDVRPRFRRCEFCRRFALLSRSKGDRQHFCDARCRCAWARSPAGRKATARRVREHRMRQPRGRRFLQ